MNPLYVIVHEVEGNKELVMYTHTALLQHACLNSKQLSACEVGVAPKLAAYKNS